MYRLSGLMERLLLSQVVLFGLASGRNILFPLELRLCVEPCELCDVPGLHRMTLLSVDCYIKGKNVFSCLYIFFC